MSDLQYYTLSYFKCCMYMVTNESTSKVLLAMDTNPCKALSSSFTKGPLLNKNPFFTALVLAESYD